MEEEKKLRVHTKVLVINAKGKLRNQVGRIYRVDKSKRPYLVVFDNIQNEWGYAYSKWYKRSELVETYFIR